MPDGWPAAHAVMPDDAPLGASARLLQHRQRGLHSGSALPQPLPGAKGEGRVHTQSGRGSPARSHAPARPRPPRAAPPAREAACMVQARRRSPGTRKGSPCHTLTGANLTAAARPSEAASSEKAPPPSRKTSAEVRACRCSRDCSGGPSGGVRWSWSPGSCSARGSNHAGRPSAKRWRRSGAPRGSAARMARSAASTYESSSSRPPARVSKANAGGAAPCGGGARERACCSSGGRAAPSCAGSDVTRSPAR